MKNTKILFVCLGNICRSPLAHGIFEHIVNRENAQDRFEIESCGTGTWHAGDLPDSRMSAEAAKHGIELTHRARGLQVMDFEYYDLILAMDNSNLRYLLSQSRDEFKHKIKLFRTFDPETDDPNAVVPDPYYGGAEGFKNVYEIVQRTCENLYTALL